MIAIGLIHLNEKTKRDGKMWKRILVGLGSVVIGSVIGLITMVDYYHAGILMVMTFYFFRGRKWWHYAGQLFCLGYINLELLGGYSYQWTVLGHEVWVTQQGFALLALIPIWLYRGRQGYHSKALQYMYYVFYPVHLLVLGLIKFL